MGGIMKGENLVIKGSYLKGPTFRLWRNPAKIGKAKPEGRWEGLCGKRAIEEKEKKARKVGPESMSGACWIPPKSFSTREEGGLEGSRPEKKKVF